MPAKTTSKKVWSDVEAEAMKESARERKAQGKRSPADERAAGEADVQAKFAEMTPDERAIAERIHAIVGETAPHLVPRTYYGMPAYAKDGKALCWFKPASKFKTRYATVEFSDQARLDDGSMWAVSYALPKLTAADETRLEALVKKAAG